MVSTTIALPDDLHKVAQAMDLDIETVCIRAVESEVEKRLEKARPESPEASAVRSVLVARRGVDDDTRYHEGYNFGFRWASNGASHRERSEAAMWASQRWNSFALSPAFNSLPRYFCEQLEMPVPDGNQPFWFERDAYTMGMVDGIAAAHDRS